MNKISTKIRQKQSIIPQQILQSRFLELSHPDIEEELQNEIEKNPVLVEIIQFVGRNKVSRAKLEGGL